MHITVASYMKKGRRKQQRPIEKHSAKRVARESHKRKKFPQRNPLVGHDKVMCNLLWKCILVNDKSWVLCICIWSQRQTTVMSSVHKYEGEIFSQQLSFCSKRKIALCGFVYSLHRKLRLDRNQLIALSDGRTQRASIVVLCLLTFALDVVENSWKSFYIFSCSNPLAARCPSENSHSCPQVR